MKDIASATLTESSHYADIYIYKLLLCSIAQRVYVLYISNWCIHKSSLIVLAMSLINKRMKLINFIV